MPATEAQKRADNKDKNKTPEKQAAAEAAAVVQKLNDAVVAMLKMCPGSLRPQFDLIMADRAAAKDELARLKAKKKK